MTETRSVSDSEINNDFQIAITFGTHLNPKNFLHSGYILSLSVFHALTPLVELQKPQMRANMMENCNSNVTALK